MLPLTNSCSTILPTLLPKVKIACSCESQLHFIVRPESLSTINYEKRVGSCLERSKSSCFGMDLRRVSKITLEGRASSTFFQTRSLAFGTASLPTYDGTSFAANQDIIIVTFNYRTNVFGFPGSPDLPLAGNNLGFLDQGGCSSEFDHVLFNQPSNRTSACMGSRKHCSVRRRSPPSDDHGLLSPCLPSIELTSSSKGQSAGSQSVSSAISRHAPDNAPFRAGIMLSGAEVSMSPIPSFTSFNNFSTGVGCTQLPGPARLACLKQVPATVIRNFTNGPTSGAFEPVVDEYVCVLVVFQLIENIENLVVLPCFRTRWSASGLA